jgi:hypothetical protein
MLDLGIGTEPFRAANADALAGTDTEAVTELLPVAYLSVTQV